MAASLEILGKKVDFSSLTIKMDSYRAVKKELAKEHVEGSITDKRISDAYGGPLEALQITVAVGDLASLTVLLKTAPHLMDQDDGPAFNGDTGFPMPFPGLKTTEIAERYIDDPKIKAEIIELLKKTSEERTKLITITSPISVEPIKSRPCTLEIVFEKYQHSNPEVAFIYATASGDLESMQYLVNTNITLQKNLNFQLPADSTSLSLIKGDTALHAAIRISSIQKRREVIIFLLEHAADPNIKNTKGISAFELLTEYVKERAEQDLLHIGLLIAKENHKLAEEYRKLKIDLKISKDFTPVRQPILVLESSHADDASSILLHSQLDKLFEYGYGFIGLETSHEIPIGTLPRVESWEALVTNFDRLYANLDFQSMPSDELSLLRSSTLSAYFSGLGLPFFKALKEQEKVTPFHCDPIPAFCEISMIEEVDFYGKLRDIGMFYKIALHVLNAKTGVIAVVGMAHGVGLCQRFAEEGIHPVIVCPYSTEYPHAYLKYLAQSSAVNARKLVDSLAPFMPCVLNVSRSDNLKQFQTILKNGKVPTDLVCTSSAFPELDALHNQSRLFMFRYNVRVEYSDKSDEPKPFKSADYNFRADMTIITKQGYLGYVEKCINEVSKVKNSIDILFSHKRVFRPKIIVQHAFAVMESNSDLLFQPIEPTLSIPMEAATSEALFTEKDLRLLFSFRTDGKELEFLDPVRSLTSSSSSSPVRLLEVPKPFTPHLALRSYLNTLPGCQGFPARVMSLIEEYVANDSSTLSP